MTEYLRRGLAETRTAPKGKLQPLPTFSAGKMLVDVANRVALYEAMDGR